MYVFDRQTDRRKDRFAKGRARPNIVRFALKTRHRSADAPILKVP